MNSTRFVLAAMVLGTALGTSQANAQCSGNAGSCSSPLTASVSVGALVKLGMTPGSTTLTAPTANDLDGGSNAVIQDAGPTFTIKSNRSWTLKIKTTNATDWTYGGSNSGVKPIGHLAWATSGGGTYTAITAVDADFTSGGGATNTGAASSFFRTTWVNNFADASNREGSYTLPIVFTLTAP